MCKSDTRALKGDGKDQTIHRTYETVPCPKYLIFICNNLKLKKKTKYFWSHAFQRRETQAVQLLSLFYFFSMLFFYAEESKYKFPAYK